MEGGRARSYGKIELDLREISKMCAYEITLNLLKLNLDNKKLIFFPR